MKKIVPLICLLFLLNGCFLQESFQDKMSQRIDEEISYENDDDYKEYLKMKENGELDDNGIMRDEDYEFVIDQVDTENLDAKVVETQGDIHISFVNLNLVDVSYFNDDDLTERFVDECYKNVGDVIYISEPKVIEGYEEAYQFEGFLIYAIDSSNRKEELANITDDYITIPNTKSKELVIEPYGHFSNTILNLHGYRVDENGKEIEMPGKNWFVDRKEYANGNAELEKVLNYSVSYNYDSSEYFVSATFPEALSSDNGLVTFGSSSINSNNNYIVELSKLINISLNGNVVKGIELLKVNGETLDLWKDLNKKNEITDIQNLKAGDEIEITTKDGYSIVNRFLNSISEPEKLKDTRKRYTFTVPSRVGENAELVISKNVNEYLSKTIENGLIKLVNASTNKELSEKDDVGSDEKIKVVITPNYGYYIIGKNVDNNKYTKTMKYSQYLKDIDDIIKAHKCIKYKTIIFDSNDAYGKVIFKVDGKQITENKVKLREDQKIEIDYEITNDSYRIARSDDGLFNSFSNAIQNITMPKKDNKSINVDTLKDGTIITRSDYIKIERKDK